VKKPANAALFEGQPWFWTITAHVGRTSSTADRGYSATREQAMADFKTQWAAQT
jgi:hypothetical protein